MLTRAFVSDDEFQSSILKIRASRTGNTVFVDEFPKD